MKAGKPLVVYLCNAVDESIRAQRQITTDSPAATNKVFGIAGAMRLAGVRCIVLSLGRGRQNSKGGWHPAVSRRSGGAALLYCGFLHLPLLTHFTTALSLVFLVVRLAWCNPGLTLLSYNRAYHYIPALIVARLMRARSCLDLEDGYIVEGRGGLRQIKNALTRRLFAWLCPHGAMVANTGLGRQLDRPPAIVCYGVASNTSPPRQDWQSGRLQVLFSGTLMEEVGSRLLVAAIDMLRQQQPELVNQLHFVVTGKGPFVDTFRALATRAPDWLSFGESLPRTAYLDMLRDSHVGLSLRLAGFEMGATTFPSKVVEYSEHGLLVLTTRASDVPLLFGDSVLYLDDETARALAAMLAGLPARREDLRKTASRGRERVLQFCSPEAVGREVRRLVTNESSHGE